jgi:AcrR family transcriptional regulator
MNTVRSTHRAATGTSKSSPKQARAVRTREQVLAAAATAFADKGFPAVTIMDIAELTGVTKGAVYFHYANKEALAVAVAEQFYLRLPRIAEAVDELDPPPLEAVAELLLRTAVAFRDDKVIQAGARLQIERALIGAELPTPYVGYTHLIGRYLLRAQEAGDLPAETDPQTVAQVLVSAFFGAQHISWILHDRADLYERTRELIEAILPAALTPGA